MLILTRRVGEALIVDEEVSITILGVKGSQVRIGVNAPKNVTIHREEVLNRMQGSQDLDKKNNKIIDDNIGNRKKD